MKLVEISFEITRAQLARASAAGVAPRILSLTFDTMDAVGKVFSCRAQFSFGNDYVAEFTLDDPADLSSGDWQARFDHVMFEGNGESRWPQ